MPRDYQPKKTKYILPSTVYHKTLWRIRDYYRLKEKADQFLGTSAIKYDIYGKSEGKRSDSTLSSAIRREKYIHEMDLITKPLKVIPVEYRQAIWENIHFRKPYPTLADRSTYGRYKSKYIYYVAQAYEQDESCNTGEKNVW